MITKYYKCTLLSDVILNQSLATSGNIATLDYIPGSVFLGVVAKDVYKNHGNQAYDILHSENVKFGDGMITDAAEKLTYHIPFALCQDKLKIDKSLYLHHLLDKKNYPTNEEGNRIQLKQMCVGYFDTEGNALNVQKRFAIKSARDSKTRKSKDAQMFGYESIREGQSFLFPITYSDEHLVEMVEPYLIGKRRIGKSKTAEYSSARIEKVKALEHQVADNPDYTLVYAYSHLSFLDEYGQPTLQPKASDLGVEGEIDWAKSQVRTYEYTSWNGKRNTPNAQRFCIARGSVFYVNKGNKGAQNIVGEYQAEGLGRILINPQFLLKTEGAKWDFEIKVAADEISDEVKPTTALGTFLKQKKKDKDKELDLSQSIVEALRENEERYKEITKSQWGNIRNYASNATDLEELKRQLFKDKKSYLTHGVAFERYWNKSNNLENFKILVEGKSVQYVAKFAAQMAKRAKQ